MPFGLVTFGSQDVYWNRFFSVISSTAFHHGRFPTTARHDIAPEIARAAEALGFVFNHRGKLCQFTEMQFVSECNCRRFSVFTYVSALTGFVDLRDTSPYKRQNRVFGLS